MDMIEERKRNEKRLAKEQRKRKQRSKAIKSVFHVAFFLLLCGSAIVTFVHLSAESRMPEMSVYAAIASMVGLWLVMAIVIAYFQGPRKKGCNCNCVAPMADDSPQFIYLHH